MFRFVDDSFKFEHAPYKVFDPKQGGNIFGELLQSDENIIYSDREWNELENFLVAKVKLGVNNHPVFIYSSVKENRRYYVSRNTNVKPSHIKILPPEYEFTASTVVSAEVCTTNDINYFKAFYMAAKVNYTTGGDFGIVFKADGRAFGFASFSKQLSTLDLIFIQSDFVASSETKRLSKLVIMLLKSHDVRMILARTLDNYYGGLKTSVYTQKPVSMKYRGVFQLERREKGKLLYVADFTNETIKTIYQSWLRKYKK